MNFSLSRYSIRKQILIGYAPVILVLSFLVLISVVYFNKIDQRFYDLNEIHEKNIHFQEVKKNLIELQRNVMVYSYIGYRGVLRKIAFLEDQIEETLTIITPSLQDDEEIQGRLERMIGHFNKYKENFLRAMQEKNRLETLRKKQLAPAMLQMQSALKKIQQGKKNKQDIKTFYELNEIEHTLYVIKTNVSMFYKHSDTVLANKTNKLIDKVKIDITLFQDNVNVSALDNIPTFITSLNDYQVAFKEIVRINRTYLHLINVVLAGKAAEMSSLSLELDALIKLRTNKFEEKINNNINRTQTQFISLLIIAIIIGVISSIFIAAGISKPVVSIANTLSKLSNGQADIEIPGQDRLDEMGQMAKSANDFKAMAKDLDMQKAELEEFAYRTSHDLRSPLISSITLLGLTQKSLERQSYDKAKSSIDLVSGSLKKLEILVKDILELTKTKTIIEEKQLININVLVEESLAKISHMDNFERLNIIKNLEFEGDIMVAKSRIILIVENLFSNAVKYQDINKDKSFIKITTNVTPLYLVITVEDNGLGIPKKYQNELFSMFKRFHPRVSFGSGLGLYMLQKSVNVINGSIAFKDTGDGCLFEVKIPL